MQFLLVVLAFGFFVTLSQVLLGALRWFVGLSDGLEPLALLVLAVILLRALYAISRRVSA